MEFYATAAQVIPLFALALTFECGYLERLDDRTPGHLRVVRGTAAVLIMACLIGEGLCLLVLSGALPDRTAVRWVVSGVVLAKMAMLGYMAHREVARRTGVSQVVGLAAQPACDVDRPTRQGGVTRDAG